MNVPDKLNKVFYLIRQTTHTGTKKVYFHNEVQGNKLVKSEGQNSDRKCT